MGIFILHDICKFTDDIWTLRFVNVLQYFDIYCHSRMINQVCLFTSNTQVFLGNHYCRINNIRLVEQRKDNCALHYEPLLRCSSQISCGLSLGKLLIDVKCLFIH